MFVTAHHARLGAWLLAKLCQDGHLRPQSSMRCKAQPSSNRTFGFPEYGFPIIFFQWLSQLLLGLPV
jgi:hypothetical protein